MALTVGTGVLFVAGLMVTIVSLARGRRQEAIHTVTVAVAKSPGDLETEILERALGESVVHGLRRVNGLEVVAHDTPVSADQVDGISSNLNTDAAVILQAERSGERLQVKLNAVKRGGAALWQETITGRVTDAAWINAEVGETVVKRLDGVPGHERPHATTSAALQQYLRGRYLWNKRLPDALDQAFQSFREAIKADPGFALAYAGLAQTYVVADLHDPRYHANHDTYRNARAAAERAIALDPGLSSGHAALAQILRNYDRDMAGAEREYRKAIDLDPNDATAHQWYAEFLSFNGRYEEAIAEIDRARELDPLSAVITAVCGTIRINAGRFDEAKRFNEEALRLDPGFYGVYSNVAAVLEAHGRYADAINALRRAAEIANDPELERAAEQDRSALARGGVAALKKTRAARQLANAQKHPEKPYELAEAYCRSGQRTQCLAYLNKAVEERSESVLPVLADPAFDSVRNDPRYLEAVKRLGLTIAPERSMPPSETIGSSNKLDAQPR